jgi:hypothetical protein
MLKEIHVSGIKVNISAVICQTTWLKRRSTSEVQVFHFLNLLIFGTIFNYFIIDQWMTSTFQCGEMLLGALDYYSTNGGMNVSQINARQLPIQHPNISKLFNNAKIPSILGGNYELDENGDLLMDLVIQIFSHDSTKPIFEPLGAVAVGNWSASSNKISLDESRMFFLGNATGPPRPVAPPTTQYKPSIPLRITFDAIVLSCCVITMFLVIYAIYNRATKVIQASNIYFLLACIFGVNISFISIFILSLYPPVSFTYFKVFVK